MKKMMAVVTVVVVTGCNNLDPYAEKFGSFEVGDSRERVVEVMGEPSAVKSIEQSPLQ